MNHTWMEMLSGVSPSIRALVVSTHCDTVVDPFRDCPCERRALELIQQCDIALRTHVEEPPWDLLRVELFQAFGDQIKGERKLTGADLIPTRTKWALQGANIVHALERIAAAARHSRQRQYDQGKTETCLRSLGIAIARSLSVARAVLEATSRGELNISVGTRAKVIDALMVRSQLVEAQEDLMARESRRPRTHDEAVAKMAEASLVMKTAEEKFSEMRGRPPVEDI